MIITSQRNNCYFISRSTPQTLLVHPLLEHLLSLHESGIDVQKWVNEFEEGTVPVRGKNIETNKKEIQYYYHYFRFLKEHKYFDTVKKVQIEDSRRYTPEKVERMMADTEQIVFEITDSCNLACRYCGYGEFYSGFDTRRGQNMDFAAAKKVIDHIIALKKKYLSTIKTHKRFVLAFYGGEPLLNFSLIKKVVDYSRTIKIDNFQFLFSITTNGVLLHKYMDFLVENRFIVIISLDGNKQNNSHRVFPNGTASFDIVYNNSRKLKTRAPRYFEKFVTFNCVVHNRNNLQQVWDFFKKEFNKKPLIIGLRKQGIRPDKEEKFAKTLKAHKTEEELKESERYSRNLKVSDYPRLDAFDKFYRFYSGYVFDKITAFLDPHETVEYVGTGTCHPFQKKIFVTVNGKLLPCERIKQTFSMGAISEGGVDFDYRMIADTYNRYYKKLGRLCNHCHNSKLCGRCIFFINIDDADEGKLKCNDFLSYKDFLEKVSRAVSYLEEKPGYYLRSFQNLEKEGDI